MLSLCRQTDGWTGRRTKVKQYAPDLSIRGHKKGEKRVCSCLVLLWGSNFDIVFLSLLKMFNMLTVTRGANTTSEDNL